MTPSEKNIVRSLITVAWADGKMADGETAVIEGLLCGFDASPEEEAELIGWGKSRRTLGADIPLGELTPEDRELLLANAALLVNADGEVSDAESRVLDQLAKLLGFAPEHAQAIIQSAADGALRLDASALEEQG